MSDVSRYEGEGRAGRSRGQDPGPANCASAVPTLCSESAALGRPGAPGCPDGEREALNARADAAQASPDCRRVERLNVVNPSPEEEGSSTRHTGV